MNISSKFIRSLMSAFAVAALVLTPGFVFAQGALGQSSNLNDIVGKVIGLFNVAIYLIIALAILTFVWNVYQYFIVQDPKDKKDASLYVMYSVIGIFVILSFWGLVNIISNTLNVNSNPGTVNVGNLLGGITSGGGSAGSGYNPFLYSASIGFGTAGASSGGSGYGGVGGGSSIIPQQGASGSNGGLGVSSYNTNSSGGISVGAGGSSGAVAPGSSQSAYLDAANAQAAADQRGLTANNCYTASGGIVNTPTCRSIYQAYQNDLTNAGTIRQSMYEQSSAAAAGPNNPDCIMNGQNCGTPAASSGSASSSGSSPTTDNCPPGTSAVGSDGSCVSDSGSGSSAAPDYSGGAYDTSGMQGN